MNTDTFCCECISFPGWTYEMTRSVICNWSDDTYKTTDCLCYEYGYKSVNFSENSSVNVSRYLCCCGLISSFINIVGSANVDIMSCFCCLFGYSHGRNELSEFCSCSTLCNGVTWASGSHHGCGVTCLTLGCFIGNAIRSCRFCCFECGERSF